MEQYSVTMRHKLQELRWYSFSMKLYFALLCPDKRVFHGHKNLADGDFCELRRLGFIVEGTKQGDGHTRLRFKTSSRFHAIPSTGSDVRGMKNSFASFETKESVYKI